MIPANTSITLSDTQPDVRYDLDEGQPFLMAVDFSPGSPSGIRFRDVRYRPSRLQPIGKQEPKRHFGTEARATILKTGFISSKESKSDSRLRGSPLRSRSFPTSALGGEIALSLKPRTRRTKTEGLGATHESPVA